MQNIENRSLTGSPGVSLADPVKLAMQALLNRISLQEYENDLYALGLTQEEVEGNRGFMDWEVRNENKSQ